MAQDGIQKTIESYSYLRTENQPKREGPSKASVYLGQEKGNIISPAAFMMSEYACVVLYTMDTSSQFIRSRYYSSTL